MGPNRQISKSSIPANTNENNSDSDPAQDKSVDADTSRKRNAFSELMSSKPKQAKIDASPKKNQTLSKKASTNNDFKSGLLPYIQNPSSFPIGTIVQETEHTILIQDLFPKALVHLLLLPRDPAFYNLTPFEAFNSVDAVHTSFLALMRNEAQSAASLAASELSRLTSSFSASSQARIEALESDDPPDTLPAGRDYLPSIKIGIHAQPSMSTLHIHIVSEDNYSPRLKHKKHYNSFNTDFFVPLCKFPLDEGNTILRPETQTMLIKGDMRCWRCGKNFGNKFVQLKKHLEQEYLEWRKM